MKQILNFRKLAEGHVNKDGMRIKNIYRSADVSRASEYDIEQLVKMQITNVIDLRSNEEKGTILDDPRICIHNIDIIGNGNQNHLENYQPSQISSLMNDLYQKKFVDTDGFKEELEYIFDLDGKPFLFHCTAGKDRTGITGIILMYILGFDLNSIIDEYLTIDHVLVEAMTSKIIKQFESENIEFDVTALQSMASVNNQFIEGYLNAVEAKYGTFDNYLEDKLGITKLMRDALCANYLQ